MKLGIMQPYFFPYLGYFSLINYVDEFIIFDPVQYIRKGWINRNRVLKKGGGVKYINITVAKHCLTTPIKDIRLSTTQDWRNKILRNLDYYEKKAPYYYEVKELLSSCFATEEIRLPQFIGHCLIKTCQYLAIPFTPSIYSEMNLQHQSPAHPGEWALHISSALGAKEYVNPPGGREIFKKDQFDRVGIKLLFLDQELLPYDQKNDHFEPGLSIIDVMMFNSPKAIRQMLQKYTLY